jgi:hypothetical protein
LTSFEFLIISRMIKCFTSPTTELFLPPFSATRQEYFELLSRSDNAQKPRRLTILRFASFCIYFRRMPAQQAPFLYRRQRSRRRRMPLSRDIRRFLKHFICSARTFFAALL